MTHAASLQQQLTLAETVGAVGELHQGFLGLVSDGGVSSLVQLLTQDLQLGKALEIQMFCRWVPDRLQRDVKYEQSKGDERTFSETFNNELVDKYSIMAIYLLRNYGHLKQPCLCQQT